MMDRSRVARSWFHSITSSARAGIEGESGLPSGDIIAARVSILIGLKPKSAAVLLCAANVLDR
jgi:hypothetical protein